VTNDSFKKRGVVVSLGALTNANLAATIQGGLSRAGLSVQMAPPGAAWSRFIRDFLAEDGSRAVVHIGVDDSSDQWREIPYLCERNAPTAVIAVVPSDQAGHMLSTVEGALSAVVVESQRLLESLGRDLRPPVTYIARAFDQVGLVEGREVIDRVRCVVDSGDVAAVAWFFDLMKSLRNDRTDWVAEFAADTIDREFILRAAKAREQRVEFSSTSGLPLLAVYPPQARPRESELMGMLAMGVPVVAVRDPVTQLVVQHGRHGYLVDAERIEDVKTYVRALGTDRYLRQRMAAAGREWAKHALDPNLCQDRYARVVKKCLRKCEQNRELH
jgi:hypothetical protein